jgi:hypothetical protein
MNSRGALFQCGMFPHVARRLPAPATTNRELAHRRIDLSPNEFHPICKHQMSLLSYRQAFWNRLPFEYMARQEAHCMRHLC